MTTTEEARPDWPFGPFLKAAIAKSGMSQRRVAIAAKISEGRLRQLISGYQKSGAIRVPISTTTTTVHNLSQVLNFDIYEGLRLAGLESSIPDEQTRRAMDESWVNRDAPKLNPDLATYSTDELFWELNARMEALEVELARLQPDNKWVEFGRDKPLPAGVRLVATEPELEAMTPQGRRHAQREFDNMIAQMNKRDEVAAARARSSAPDVLAEAANVPQDDEPADSTET